jgi:hypothetical protein
MSQHLSRRHRWLLAVAAAALITGTAPPALAVLAPPGHTPGATVKPAPPAQAARQLRPVTLINGDRLLAEGGPGGGMWHELMAGTSGGINAQLVTTVLGGRTYVVPLDALPYLGRGLDPSLFDLASLLHEPTGGRLPLQVRYTGRMPSFPGITITSAGGGKARGYLTAASARAFGTALARQFTADHARGSYGRDGMFPGRVRISLAGVPAAAGPPGERAPVAAPSRRSTLRVTGTNLAGKPDTGDEVLVYNADDSRRYHSAQNFDNGAATFRVPPGHYWAVGIFVSSGGQGNRGGQRIVVLPQFTVRGRTTVHMDERTARQIQIVTPRPTRIDYTYLTLARSGRSGPSVLVGLGDGTSQPVWVAPTGRKPTVGALHVITFSQLDSPPGTAGTPYEYGVAYQNNGTIPARQRRVVSPAALAVVHARYYQAPPALVQQFLTVGIPGYTQGSYSGRGVIFRAPSRINEYLSAGPSDIWSDEYFQQAAYLNEAGGQFDPGKTFTPGEHVTENWGSYPLHTAPDVNLAGAPTPQMVSASRAGNRLGVYVTPFSDNQFGDTGSGYTPIPHVTFSGRYQIDENGKKIAGGRVTPPKGGYLVGFGHTATVSGRPSLIRFLLSAVRQGRGYPLSSASRTVWTWRSSHEAGHMLPPGWTCITGSGNSRSCAVEPMMTLRYAVVGLALDGATHPGRQVLHVSAGHLQLVRAIAVTRASVSVSFDGGKTWHPTHVTGHNGSYTATFTAPAGAKVSLRTSAADTAGGSITETITNGYQTSS